MCSCQDFARSTLYAVFLLAALSQPASSQVAVGYTGSLPTEKNSDLNQEMQLGTPLQREGLLKALGVDLVFVNEIATAVPHTELRIDPVDGTDANLLFLPCGGPGSPQAYFYLLRPGQDQHWHAIDSVHLDCWSEPTSYEWIQVQGKPGRSILAHHVNHGHGSGMVEDHMQLFEVRGDHLVSVLDTEEYTSQAKAGTNDTTQHSSTLLSFPDGSIEETRITTNRNGSTDQPMPASIVSVERRRWHCVEHSKSYVPGKFVVIHP